MGREDIDILYEAVSAEQRRRVLAVLTEAEDPLGGDELARRIAARRSAPDRRDDAPDRTRATQIGISLTPVHLPKLEESGAVERTAEGEYAVTPLGRDLERAARAFEAGLDADGDRDVADDARSSPDRRDTVPASEYEGDAQ